MKISKLARENFCSYRKNTSSGYRFCQMFELIRSLVWMILFTKHFNYIRS